MIEACIELFRQLRSRFSGRANQIPGKDDRNFLIAACRSWFGDYRGHLNELGVTDDELIPIDKIMQFLLQAAGTSRRRNFYQSKTKELNQITQGIFTSARISHWKSSQRSSLADQVVSEALKNLDEDLERRYSQFINDLEASRYSYAGTANELREIIRIVLHTKAPDDQVATKDWYKVARTSNNKLPEKPTQVERVRFILDSKRANGNVIENAQSNERLIDELLGKVVRSSYGRMNGQAHGQEDRDELIRSLRYVHAFLKDLL